MWFAIVASLVLLAVVAAVFWSAWGPFSADMKENAPVVIPLTAIVAIVVLAPPVAWAIAGL
jgi:hypothetical protein